MRRTLVIAVVAAVAEQRHRCFTRPEDFDVGALNGRWSNRTGGGYDAAAYQAAMQNGNNMLMSHAAQAQAQRAQQLGL